jgi:hypothetical protein
MSVDIPRLATFERDSWRLESGEARHAESPETFWIPSRRERESLGVGAGAKLLFEIETNDAHGPTRGVERMWVIVRRRLPGLYVGVLDSQPAAAEGDSRVLARGAEVVFGPEHVIDISEPSPEYVEEHYGAGFFDSDAGQ